MARTWAEARTEVERIAQEHGNLPIYWGTGDPIYKPHVVAAHMCPPSGNGYYINVYPKGAAYLAPVESWWVFVD